MLIDRNLFVLHLGRGYFLAGYFGLVTQDLQNRKYLEENCLSIQDFYHSEFHQGINFRLDLQMTAYFSTKSTKAAQQPSSVTPAAD